MDLPQDPSVDDHSRLEVGRTGSSSDMEPPYDQAFGGGMGLHPSQESGRQGQGEVTVNVSEGSRGTSLRSAREHDEEEPRPRQVRLQQLQESPGHSELSRMERGATAAPYSGAKWATAVTQALDNPSESGRDAISESALRNMEVDEQELVPDYQSLLRTEVPGRMAEQAGRDGPLGPSGVAMPAASSSGATAMVPAEALGTVVAQLMQPWMEQMMNSQVLLMARTEQMEVARAQSERMSGVHATAGLHRGGEVLSQPAEKQAASARADASVFSHVAGSGSLGVPASALDWSFPQGFKSDPPALPAQLSRGYADFGISWGY